MSDAVPEPAQAYLQLRQRILNLRPEDVSLTASSEAPHVWSVIMETGYEVGSATLVALADGTTSLYYSTGGGMLGSGEYAPLAQASKALVAQAESHLSQMTPGTDFPLPEVGQVRFILLTYHEKVFTTAREEDLATGSHPLSPLFSQAKNTLTQLRIIAEQKKK
jgi:hypothetical protein